MNLPAHYTVAEIIDALEVILKRQELNRDTFKAQYEKAKEPKYEKTWFGYYKNVTPEPSMWHGWPFSIEYEHYKEAALSISKELSALRKLPLDAKVKLTVKEINELFNTRETT